MLELLQPAIDKRRILFLDKFLSREYNARIE